MREQLAQRYLKAGDAAEAGRWWKAAHVLWTGYSDQHPYVHRKAEELVLKWQGGHQAVAVRGTNTRN